LDFVDQWIKATGTYKRKSWKMGTEKTLEYRLKREVEKRSGLCLKIWCVSFTGLPDRLVLMKGGRIWFVEMKSPTGKLSSRQIAIHRILAGLGFQVRVLSTVDQLLTFINEIQ
jgi:hypothetical protein